MPDPSTSPLRVGPTLEARAFAEIRREMELSHFKWDVQVGDVTAIATFPLLIGGSTWRDLATWAEETRRSRSLWIFKIRGVGDTAFASLETRRIGSSVASST